MPASLPATIVRAIASRLERALECGPLHYRPLRADGSVVGWLDDARVMQLAQHCDGFIVSDAAVEIASCEAGGGASTDACVRLTARVAPQIRRLAAARALTAWRNEVYGARERFEDPPAFLLERAAARFFGVRTYAAHANGLAGPREAPRMWVARRSASKAIDPCMLDNLVGGGIAYGNAVADTLIKEAWEEAGIAQHLARKATLESILDVHRPVDDGLQRETIYAHDLWLPDDFVPANQDGEAVEHRLIDLEEVARLLSNESGPDVVTVDATLVAADFLIRHGAISTTQPDGARLVQLVGRTRA